MYTAFIRNIGHAFRASTINMIDITINSDVFELDSARKLLQCSCNFHLNRMNVPLLNDMIFIPDLKKISQFFKQILGRRDE